MAPAADADPGPATPEDAGDATVDGSNDALLEPPRPPADPWASDALLGAVMRRVLPDTVRAAAVDELAAFARRCGDGGDLLAMADDAETDPPELVRYDPWGRRVDRLALADGWWRLKAASAEEGLVALAYDPDMGAAGRLLQAAKVHLFQPSSAVYTCPLAMADGAARVLATQAPDAAEAPRNPADAAEVLDDALERLTTRDPARAWTSGQWMTERAGGSDVSRTGTVARWDAEARDGTGAWRLFGRKWFTSSIESEVALALARVADPETGETTPGSEGLGLFVVPVWEEADGVEGAGDGADDGVDDGAADPPDDGPVPAPARRLRDGIRIERLKDKLGTRALPTAETVLDGAEAILLGRPGEGIRRVATLLNITRTWNALCSVGHMRRALDLAKDHARRREAFGRRLADLPLHVETLARLEVRVAGSFHLAFFCAELLGRVEAGEATDRERRVLRLLTPVAKLFTAKEAVAVSSEAVECFGGAGYVEDTDLPRLLRDAQVLSIWEGTTNVLALDAVRAMLRDGAGEAFLAAIADRVEDVDAAELEDAGLRVDAAVLRLEEALASLAERDPADVEAGARRLAYGLARTFAAGLMVEHAAWALRSDDEDAARAVEAADRWCAGEAGPLVEDLDADKARREGSRRLAFGPNP